MENNEDIKDTNTVEGNEGTGKVDTQTTNQNEGTEVDVKVEAQKMADAIVAKKLKGMPSKEELKAFKEWQESQKTAEEKQAEKEAEYLKKDNLISDLEKENAVLKAGVKEDIDYVLFKVSRMEGDFSENLAKFLKENPKFTSSENKEIKTVGTSAKLDGNSRTENSTNQTMNDLIRSARS